MSDIAKLRDRKFDEQLNLWIPRELKIRIMRLKTEHRIDTPTELKKAIERHVNELEKAI